MIAKFRAFWSTLPHGLQAGVVSFGVSVGIELLQLTADGCFSGSCLKKDLGAAVASGLAALRAFYMVPNKPQQGGQ